MDAAGRGVHASSGYRVSPGGRTMDCAITLRHDERGHSMSRTTTTPFDLNSTAATLMRVGLGTWATQVMVARGFAQIPFQWSRAAGM